MIQYSINGLFGTVPDRFDVREHLIHEAGSDIHDTVQRLGDDILDSLGHAVGEGGQRIGHNTCVGIDTVRKSVHEVRHPALKVGQRSLIRNRKVQERTNFIRHAPDRIRHLSDAVLDAANDTVNDVCAPLERLRCKSLDEADGSIEAVDDGVLDRRDLLRHGIFHAVPDVRNGCFDSVHHVCDGRLDAVPDIAILF